MTENAACVSVAPVAMVRLLATAVEPMIGAWCVPAGMLTLVPEVGTVPPHQLAGRSQSALDVPSQLPGTFTVSGAPSETVPSQMD